MGAFRKRFGAVRFELCFTRGVWVSREHEYGGGGGGLQLMHAGVESFPRRLKEYKQGVSNLGKDVEDGSGLAEYRRQRTYLGNVIGCINTPVSLMLSSPVTRERPRPG